jgi:hypothetical protein
MVGLFGGQGRLVVDQPMMIGTGLIVVESPRGFLFDYRNIWIPRGRSGNGKTGTVMYVGSLYKMRPKNGFVDDDDDDGVSET